MIPMLFRGNTPLTPDECVDHEIGCALERLREDGLLLQTTDPDGGSIWSLTLRGSRDLDQVLPRSDSLKLLRITFCQLDCSC